MTQYLIVKGTSGIGNRLLAVATGLLYGRISGRTVVVDWRDGSYSNDGTNLFFRYFDCPLAHDTSELPALDSVFPPIWQNKLDISLGRLKKEFSLEGYKDMSIDVSKLDYQEEILVFCAYTHKIKPMRVLFTGEFSHFAKMSNTEILKFILQSEITLKEDIQARVKEFQERYFLDYTVGVHIRYSDVKVPLDKIENKLRQITKKLEKHHQNCTIFIATDSQAVLSSFKAKFPNVISTDKWFSTSGKRLHQNPEECSDLVQNGIEALTDLYLLASCDCLVFASRSSFGFLASLLMSNPETELYDIDKPTIWQKIRGKLKKWVGIK